MMNGSSIDKKAIKEIEKIRDQLIHRIRPLRVYLFGSFAEGKGTDDSDFDFYLVVANETEDIADLTASAYKAIRSVRTRAVDILIGTESRFEERKEKMSIENEVYYKGTLLYEDSADRNREYPGSKRMA